jgi:hypothetical protein
MNSNPAPSSGQKWWQIGVDPVTLEPQARVGLPCPKCLMDDLAYDTLFRLRCPNCGYIAECGAFT